MIPSGHRNHLHSAHGVHSFDFPTFFSLIGKKDLDPSVSAPGGAPIPLPLALNSLRALSHLWGTHHTSVVHGKEPETLFVMPLAAAACGSPPLPMLRPPSARSFNLGAFKLIGMPSFLYLVKQPILFYSSPPARPLRSARHDPLARQTVEKGHIR